MNPTKSQRLIKPLLSSLALALSIGGASMQANAAPHRTAPPRPAPPQGGRPPEGPRAPAPKEAPTTSTPTTAPPTDKPAPPKPATPTDKPAPPKPAPKPQGGDIGLIEGALGRTLTDTEKAAITAAAAIKEAALDAIQKNFVAEVAAIFGLTGAELQTKTEAAAQGGQRDPAILLASALGRSLTADETAQLKIAIATRDAGCKAAIDAYRASVAAAVGLSLADLDAKIKVFLDRSKPQGGGTQGGNKPPGGKGPGGKCGDGGTTPSVPPATTPTTPPTTDPTYQ